LSPKHLKEHLKERKVYFVFQRHQSITEERAWHSMTTVSNMVANSREREYRKGLWQDTTPKDKSPVTHFL
jgi:hypothetical protein